MQICAPLLPSVIVLSEEEEEEEEEHRLQTNTIPAHGRVGNVGLKSLTRSHMVTIKGTGRC